jgi:hypothetical protein
VTLGFLCQPSSSESTLAAFLRRTLDEPGIESLTVVVAWARFRGLVRLQPEIELFRKRGGEATLIVGIDEGGATRPGLLLATALFDRAYVFHDPGGGTFHPKVYLAEGKAHAVLAVGSSNATPGGWFSNYEASLEARFELPEDNDDPALSGVRQYIRSLQAQDALCVPLTEELVDRLVRNRRYRVAGNERPRRGGRTGGGDDGEADDLDASGSSEDPSDGESLFGARVGPRTVPPSLSSSAREKLSALEIAPDDEAEGDDELDPPAKAATAGVDAPADRRIASTAVATTVKSWSKVLPPGDAQQQGAANTNLTANVRLTKAGHDIDWRTWFRGDLFGPASWRGDTDTNGNPIERADLPLAVTIGGVSLGTMELEVTHAPHREAGQANHTTVLRWGPLLPTLKATDYTGHTLTLRRMSDGTFALDID